MINSVFVLTIIIVLYFSYRVCKMEERMNHMEDYFNQYVARNDADKLYTKHEGRPFTSPNDFSTDMSNAISDTKDTLTKVFNK